MSKERAVFKITLFIQTMTKPPLLSPPSTSLPPLRVERDNARVNCCLGSFHSFVDKQFLHSVFKRVQTNQSMFL